MKTCIDCHFLASPHLETGSVSPTHQDDRAYLRVELLGEEPDEVTKDRLDQYDVFSWALLKKTGINCWKGIWSMDQVVMESEEDRALLRRYLSVDREATGGCPYLFDFRPSMTLASADELRKYEVELRDKGRANKYKKFGLWFAAIGLLITAISTTVNMVINLMRSGAP